MVWPNSGDCPIPLPQTRNNRPCALFGTRTRWPCKKCRSDTVLLIFDTFASTCRLKHICSTQPLDDSETLWGHSRFPLVDNRLHNSEGTPNYGRVTVRLGSRLTDPFVSGPQFYILNPNTHCDRTGSCQAVSNFTSRLSSTAVTNCR